MTSNPIDALLSQVQGESVPTPTPAPEYNPIDEVLSSPANGDLPAGTTS